jgi:serine/threonine-protein kinase
VPERYLGQTLGKYRVDAIIGSGGFAWVYKAYDPELEIPVALKILKPQYAGDEKFEERFRREASTAAKLRHPNIIKIYAVGREDDAVYFAMDYLPQGLADRLNVMTTLPESMLIRMAIDVASAVGFAHREGVIHRDIKVDNILFDDHGNAIVADFGIARAVSGYAEQTGTNMVVGTPQYFSPEQARGLQLDGRSDIYSLGVTLFKASTGQLPFQGTDWYEIARQHVEDKPPRPRSINPGLSREMEEVILQCLEKDVEDRFQSGEAMCEDLLHILQERGETAAIRTMMVPPADTLSSPRSLSSRRASSRWRRRLKRAQERKWWAGAGGAVLLTAILLARLVVNDEPVANAQDGLPSDSARQVVASSSETAGGAGAARPRPRLVVDAPPRVEVQIDGRPLGTGRIETDTLAPGSYFLTASVAGQSGCPTTSVGDSVTIADTGTTTVALTPRRCGTVMIRMTRGPERGNITYTIRPVNGSRARASGSLPLREPLLLPEGAYLLHVQGPPYCSNYQQQFAIRADQETPTLTFAMLCGA